MKSMMEALKAKRMGQAPAQGLMSDDAPASYGDQPGEQEPASPMADLLSKLSPDQKQELSALLENDPDVPEIEPGEETPGAQIAQGAPSSTEKAKIDGKMQAQGAGDESDDIQMSMLDSRSKNAPDDAAPRNLGERARLAAAQRLKGKGKL